MYGRTIHENSLVHWPPWQVPLPQGVRSGLLVTGEQAPVVALQVLGYWHSVAGQALPAQRSGKYEHFADNQ